MYESSREELSIEVLGHAVGRYSSQLEVAWMAEDFRRGGRGHGYL